MNNAKRMGRFTSSNIYKLIPEGRFNGFAAPAITYIKEKQIERKMGRCLDVDAHSNAMAWGNFMELVVFQLLGLEYEISSKETDLHPDNFLSQYWAGSNDTKVDEKRIAEIKAYQPKKFGLYANMLEQKDIELFKKDFPQEYWQIVSNCAIHQVPNGEAILYMPYEKEMPAIRKMAEEYEGPDQWKYRFIYEKSNDELAVLPDHGKYENINIFEFEVPREDFELLEMRVREAGRLLDQKL